MTPPRRVAILARRSRKHVHGGAGVDEPLSVLRGRAALAARLGRAPAVPCLRGAGPPQVLLPRHVPLSLGGRSPCRACRGLRRDRHPLPVQADARVQRAPPHGMGRLRRAGEQYAVRTGVHPARTTAENIATFRRQMKRLGLSYDWEREVNTTDPDYYRWTQWIFLKLFERGLAYVAELPVNWFPALATVLADEEVVNGKSEVGECPVMRRPMRQWVLRITAYADGC